MSASAPSGALAAALAYLAIGAALGFAHLALLRLNVRLFIEGRGAAPVALCLARTSGVVAAFALIARRGAAALLLALAGFSATRLLLWRRS